MEKNVSGNPLIYLVRKMWHYAEGNRQNVVLYASLCTVANVIVSAEPLLLGLFLNAVQAEGVSRATAPHLLFLLGSLFILDLAFWLFHGPSRIIEGENAFFVRASYKNYLLQGVMALPIEWHVDHHSGDTIDKIEKGTDALFAFSSVSFEFIETVLAMTTALGVLVVFDPFVALVAVVIAAPTFYLLAIFDKQLVVGYAVVNKLENNISAKVFDTLSNITSIIILRAEALVLKSLGLFIEKPFGRYDKNIKLNEYKWFLARVLGRLIVVVTVGAYIITHIALGHTILVGTLYILYQYSERVGHTFWRFAYLYNDVVKQRATVANSEELSQDFRELIDSRHKKLPKKWSELEIQNLAFSYHPTEGADLHLDAINMKITKGERIALIGESGGGKSTFLKILRDLYRPKTLELSINGKNTGLGFDNISDSISLVPQDPEIFATTIRENITLGVEYPDTHIKAFTDLARFTEVVTRLPRGLESSIVEKGVNLSGGEKQRLALTRGLLASADKEIVLLDEPTSSVDFENELEIYKDIFSNFKNKTIISSIHRLHLLSLFDAIYIFSNGKIVASGSLEQLKGSSPDFQELWQKYIETRDAT